MEHDNYKIYQKAEGIARRAHKDQVRRGGDDFINHPLTVAKNCTHPDEKIVAVLHDVIEDTTVTATNLMTAGIPFNLVISILAITKVKNETYSEYLKRCKNDLIACQVKIQDIKHNYSTLEHDGQGISRVRRERYEIALEYLQGES